MSDTKSGEVEQREDVLESQRPQQMHDVEEQTHHPKNWWNYRVLLNAIIIGLSLGLYGYDNAFVSPLISLPLFVLKYQGPGAGGLPIFSADNLDLIVTVPLVGAALGAFTSIPIQGTLGRKRGMIAAYGLCCIPGSFLQLFAPNMGAMVVGRCWNYVGIAILTVIAPLYLSEILPAHVRARAVGFSVSGTGAVAVIAATVVWRTEQIPTPKQYQIPLAVQVVFPIVLLLLSLFLTESPVWLLARGRVEEAHRNLLALRHGNGEVVDAEMAVQSLALKQNEERKSAVKWHQIFQGPNLERTLMSGFPVCAGQVGGQALSGTYSTVLLVQSGVSDAFKITVLVFLLTFLGQLAGPYLMDRFGRRPVALIGFVFIFMFCMAAGGLAFTGLTTQPQSLGLAALSIIFGFINACSFSSLTFLAPVEIPTASLREATITWATFWGYVVSIITTFAIPQIISPGAGDLGAKAYVIFGGCMVISIVITYFYLPETGGRTLADIDELYATGLPKRKWRKYRCRATEESATRQVEVIEAQAK